MGFEVDFLPVEAGEKSGDAIAMRIWDEGGFWVIVIDGGYTSDGNALAHHINSQYGTNRVNLVISTHADADHVGGLVRLVERMDVNELWMHRPWNHRNLAWLTDGRSTVSSLQTRVRRDLQAAKDLEKAAKKKGIPITEPYSNTSFAKRVFVIGPTEDFYKRQLANFDCMPASIAQPPPQAYGTLGALAGLRRALGTPPPTLRSVGYLGAFGAATKQEGWQSETLDGECDTSAENNSGVILAVNLAGTENGWGMFTGDAGESALMSALDWLDATKFKTSRFQFVQIPHHGSEHNISPAVLNRWLGMPQTRDVKTRTAYVSSAKKAPKHPSDKVMNAFRRRGALAARSISFALARFSIRRSDSRSADCGQAGLKACATKK